MIDPDDIAEHCDDDDGPEDYSNLDDLPPMLVRVEPEPFATGAAQMASIEAAMERARAARAVERMAADLAGAFRSAHSTLAAALDKVPAAERAAVTARARPAVADIIELLAGLYERQPLRIVRAGGDA